MRIIFGLVVVLVGASAAAEPRVLDAEAVRSDLVTLIARHFEHRGGRFVETSREVRSYDKDGHVKSVVFRKPKGALIARTDYTWVDGRVARRSYQDHTKRREVRTFTYQVDATGRVTERTMVNPAATNGEAFKTTISWRADGSRDETTYRHYAKEGPYRDTTQVYDAGGQLSRSCHAGGTCEMYERDAHGEVRRVRQQTKEDHHYLVYDNTYDASGRLEVQKVGSLVTRYTYDAGGDVTEVLREDHDGVRSKTVFHYARR